MIGMMMMIDVPLSVCVVGVVLIAVAVDLAAMIEWIRRQ